MTTPDTAPLTDGSQTAMILLELGKQSTSLAILNTKLDVLVSAKDDHEQRLRTLESAAQQIVGGKDTQARVTSWTAVAAAVAAGIAGYLHH